MLSLRPSTKRAYATGRCTDVARVDRLVGPQLVTSYRPCKLKLGHKGPHQPIELGKQTVKS